MDNIDKKGKIVKKLFETALDIKVNNYENYGKLDHAFYDLIFINNIKKLMGRELMWMLSGVAPLQREVLQRLKVMIGCPMVNGYGQTENVH